MSQRTAWRGGLWFCPLRLTDHRMMNHTPAQSTSAHTHTHTRKPTGGSNTAPPSASYPESMTPSLVGHVCTSSTEGSRKGSKDAAEGRREEAEPQPYAVRASLPPSL